MQKHAVLIVGCGSIGERHLRCFLATGRARVVACEANTALLKRIQETYGVEGVADWKAAFASGEFTDAVICTPATLHVEMGIRAMESGLNVLIEKPLSHSLDNVQKLMAVQTKSGKHASVAYVFHVFPFLAGARAHVLTGALGPLCQVTVTSGQPFHRLRPAYAQTYYRDRASGGGAIQDALTHAANWVESVVGPTDSLLCDCAHLALPSVEVEDTVHISARHGAVLTNYTLNQFQAPNETTIQINGVKGSVKIEFHRQRWGSFSEGDTDWTWYDAPPAERDTHFTRQANAFLDGVEGKGRVLCSLDAAADTLRFNLAALKASETGRRVRCADLVFPS